jgi:hypothetical protein
MEIYGKEYSVNELRRRVGNMDQIAGVRTVQLDDGNERPTRAAILSTGTGLEVTVLLDRCLDIAAASFNGQAMGWRSTTGDVAPQYFEAEGIRWLRSYFGGLVTTCGLNNVGAPEEGSELSGNGLHGRIGNTPARNLKITQEWQGDDYVLAVEGTMRQTALFHENLTLTRRVHTKLGEKRFWIEDKITNEGFSDTSYMLLYHCNFGWPVVDDGSELISPSRHVAPRDDVAREGKEDWNQFHGPTHDYAEKVYFHDMAPAEDGYVTVGIVNSGSKRGTPFGAYVRYNQDALPRFTEWKMLGEQDYVVGLEPCNCGVEGKHVDEELGLLRSLAPGASCDTSLELGALSTDAEVDALRARCSAVKPEIVGSYRDFLKG